MEPRAMGADSFEEDEFSFSGDVGELSGDEAFGVGYKAGQEEVKDELEKLLRDLENPHGVETAEGEHPGQSCEEAHADCPHEAYIAGQC
jgi:hypothetical protein